jgi:hypothetical protein
LNKGSVSDIGRDQFDRCHHRDGVGERSASLNFDGVPPAADIEAATATSPLLFGGQDEFTAKAICRAVSGRRPPWT